VQFLQPLEGVNLTMMEMDLRIDTRMVEGIPILHLSGEVDAYTCPFFREAMLDTIENGSPSMVINMDDVEYIDSSGLGTLVGGLKRASEKGGKIALVCNAPQVRKVFEITGLEKVFAMFETEEEAANNLASLAKENQA